MTSLPVCLQLVYMDVSNNHLTGTLPDTWKNIPQVCAHLLFDLLTLARTSHVSCTLASLATEAVEPELMHIACTSTLKRASRLMAAVCAASDEVNQANMLLPMYYA